MLRHNGLEKMHEKERPEHRARPHEDEKSGKEWRDLCFGGMSMPPFSEGQGVLSCASASCAEWA